MPEETEITSQGSPQFPVENEVTAIAEPYFKPYLMTEFERVIEKISEPIFKQYVMTEYEDIDMLDADAFVYDEDENIVFSDRPMIPQT